MHLDELISFIFQCIQKKSRK